MGERSLNSGTDWRSWQSGSWPHSHEWVAPTPTQLGNRAQPWPRRGARDAKVSYDRIPYFYSDQYDVGMEYSGDAPKWDELVFRGDPAGGEFIAFWLQDGRVIPGMNVNVWDVNEHVQAFIRSRQQIGVTALSDPDTSLESLVAASMTGG